MRELLATGVARHVPGLNVEAMLLTEAGRQHTVLGRGMHPGFAVGATWRLSARLDACLPSAEEYVHSTKECNVSIGGSCSSPAPCHTDPTHGAQGRPKPDPCILVPVEGPPDIVSLRRESKETQLKASAFGTRRQHRHTQPSHR